MLFDRSMRFARSLLFGAALVFSAQLAMAQQTVTLKEGDKAPDFSLPSTGPANVRLADFAGKKSVVLFFYIGAFTKS